ncbi:GNAT family N-acetyltransferase [Sporosarcina trichiuri]|uniref:GNAT family N-acetyltransferase n=1 Tax=Sporosarcina trichiuri TaxID=3056445 RepID=UPI0025B56671|nr:GNAT family N-acetyltransferase [Sporosarcina sp. 0.2-SM1T-5]WJY26281.1 GNAT family N-acetyltransferase [Sporosarcina sp. 0.2-SM1T-5]
MLTEEQLTAIRQLQEVCETHDGVEMKLNWDMLKSRKGDQEDFFIWKDGTLIAYLALYAFGSTVEVCGMVLPQERRHGHFTRLWEEAQEAIRAGGFRKVLLNAPGESRSAKGWLAGQPCSYSFSEFHMQWAEQPVGDNPGIAMRLSEPADKAFEVELDAEAFSLTAADAEHYYEERLARQDERRYIIEADGNPSGKIRVARSAGESYISGFAVASGLRGQGIGGEALRWILQHEAPTGNTICLDVETRNANALKLYERIGFERKQQQDYYEAALPFIQ